MTRKHFIDLAKMIIELTRNDSECLTANNLINKLTDICYKHNNNFDYNTFINYIEKNK